MHPLRESFRDILAALGTQLGRAIGIDLDHSLDGSFSLGLQAKKEQTPRSVIDGSGKMVVLPYPQDVQFLDVEDIEPFDQVVSGFMLEIGTGILHPLMGFGEEEFRLFPAFRLGGEKVTVPITTSPTFEPFLTVAKMSLGFLKMPWIGNRGVIVG